MGLADLFKKKNKEELLIEHGTTGTEILSGMIQEEYNNDLQFPQSVKIYDEMRKSDGAVAGVLRAIKQPLTSAVWTVQAGGEDDKDKEIQEFVDRNLFENIDFKTFLKESLAYLDFGFYYFEKVFTISKDGMVEWKKFAPRIPRSHYLWEIRGKEWIDGHPAGVTQQVVKTDEGKYDTIERYIPWSKLILFTNEQEGNNFEGVSLLRPAYKHYFYKDLTYKINGISNERYGVGVPMAKVKTTMTKENKDKVEEAASNIRSNEKSYLVLTEDVSEFKILTPEGTGVGSQLKDTIDHHNKQIYDSILAGFLNLTSGEGGSNALSKDQSSFFLRGLQGVADYICDVMNRHIKELVDMNYNDVKTYPYLVVSEIGQTSMDENINAINTAVSGGLITYRAQDEIFVRNILKMQGITLEEVEQLRAEKAAQAVVTQVPEEKKTPEEQVAERARKMSNRERRQWDEIVDNIKNSLLAEENDKKKVPTKREVEFTKNITTFEKYLDGKFEELDGIIVDFEKQYRDALIELYDESDKTRVDGVECLVYDKTRITAGKNKINKITAKLEKKLIDSQLQDEIFDEAIRASTSTMDENAKYAWSLDVPQGQVNTFIDGYKSNMQGVIFNESRRVLENITLNYGSEASIELAKNTASEFAFNRNILALSFITHPRALYKYIIYDGAQKDGYTFYKPIVPSNKMQNVVDRPYGMTASILFKVLTAAQINKIASEMTGGKTAEAVTGLGLHHGSFEYYYPIESVDLDMEEEIAKIQREEFKKKSNS